MLLLMVASIPRQLHDETTTQERVFRDVPYFLARDLRNQDNPKARVHRPNRIHHSAVTPALGFRPAAHEDFPARAPPTRQRHREVRRTHLHQPSLPKIHHPRTRTRNPTLILRTLQINKKRYHAYPARQSQTFFRLQTRRKQGRLQPPYRHNRSHDMTLFCIAMIRNDLDENQYAYNYSTRTKYNPNLLRQTPNIQIPKCQPAM